MELEGLRVKQLFWQGAVGVFLQAGVRRKGGC